MELNGARSGNVAGRQVVAGRRNIRQGIDEIGDRGLTAPFDILTRIAARDRWLHSNRGDSRSRHDDFFEPDWLLFRSLIGFFRWVGSWPLIHLSQANFVRTGVLRVHGVRCGLVLCTLRRLVLLSAAGSRLCDQCYRSVPDVT